jgi:hypothetical protein
MVQAVFVGLAVVTAGLILVVAVVVYVTLDQRVLVVAAWLLLLTPAQWLERLAELLILHPAPVMWCIRLQLLELLRFNYGVFCKS